MAGHGGKRENAGRKPDTKNRMVLSDIEKLQPSALELVTDLLQAAKSKDCTVAQKADIARTVLPYLLKKQPQAVEHLGDKDHPLIHSVRIEIVR